MLGSIFLLQFLSCHPCRGRAYPVRPLPPKSHLPGNTGGYRIRPYGAAPNLFIIYYLFAALSPASSDPVCCTQLIYYLLFIIYYLYSGAAFLLRLNKF